MYIVEPDGIDAVEPPWRGEDVCKVGSIGLPIIFEGGLAEMAARSGRIPGEIRVVPTICFPCDEITLVFPLGYEEPPEGQLDTCGKTMLIGAPGFSNCARKPGASSICMLPGLLSVLPMSPSSLPIPS